MKKLWISAGIKATQGKDLSEVRSALSDLVVATQLEPKNIHFEVLENIEKPGSFTLWECWDDDTALKKHFEAPHTLNYLAQEWTEVVYVEKLNYLGSTQRGINK